MLVFFRSNKALSLVTANSFKSAYLKDSSISELSLPKMNSLHATESQMGLLLSLLKEFDTA